MAVNNLVMLAMGRGSEMFSASITLSVEQSRQNIALAWTRGLVAASGALRSGEESLPEITGASGAAPLLVLSDRRAADAMCPFPEICRGVEFAGA